MVSRIKNNIVYVDGIPVDFATQVGGNTAPMNVARNLVDASGNAIALINAKGLVGTYATTTAVSKTVAAIDLETIIETTATVTITIPTDATLGLSGPVTNFLTIGFFQRSAITPVISPVNGTVTIRGTPPTVSQYGTFGVMRVAANEWVYV